MKAARRVIASFVSLSLFGALGAIVLLDAPREAEAKPKRHRHHHDGGAEATPDVGGAARDPHDPGCLYGSVLDGHTGRLRCLSPEEVTPAGPYDTPVEDAGAIVPPPDAAPGDAGPRREAGPDASDDTPIPLKRTVVQVGSLAFENGDVPHAQAVLRHLAKGELSKCASEHGGVRGGEGKIELKFLVRARGRAEGVDPGSVRGVPPEVLRCIVGAIANHAVGAPSSDPVAVTVVLELRPAP